MGIEGCFQVENKDFVHDDLINQESPVLSSREPVTSVRPLRGDRGERVGVVSLWDDGGERVGVVRGPEPENLH